MRREIGCQGKRHVNNTGSVCSVYLCMTVCTWKAFYMILLGLVCIYEKNLLVHKLLWLGAMYAVCMVRGSESSDITFLFWLMKQLSNSSFSPFLAYIHVHILFLTCRFYNCKYVEFVSVLSGHHYKLLALLCSNDLNQLLSWHQLLADGLCKIKKFW